MTKGELIELVIQNVQGGIVNQDTSRQVRYEDVATYLAPAINYAITKSYYANKREEGEWSIPNDFISTYTVDVKFDPVRGIKYSDLPARLITLPSNRGIRSVSALQGFDTFIEGTFEGRSHDQYYSGSFADKTVYYLMGQTLEYVNIPPQVTKVLVRMIVSIQDLDDEDEVPVPAGTEIEVIQICTEFFTGQRSLSPDTVNNNTPN